MMYSALMEDVIQYSSDDLIKFLSNPKFDKYSHYNANALSRTQHFIYYTALTERRDHILTNLRIYWDLIIEYVARSTSRDTPISIAVKILRGCRRNESINMRHRLSYLLLDLFLTVNMLIKIDLYVVDSVDYEELEYYEMLPSEWPIAIARRDPKGRRRGHVHNRHHE
jgi:hypothetical protein